MRRQITEPRVDALPDRSSNPRTVKRSLRLTALIRPDQALAGSTDPLLSQRMGKFAEDDDGTNFPQTG